MVCFLKNPHPALYQQSTQDDTQINAGSSVILAHVGKEYFGHLVPRHHFRDAYPAVVGVKRLLEGGAEEA
jgi:hypothetical protein